MTTPIEDEVLAALSDKLRSNGVGESVIAAITQAYLGTPLPNPEQLLAILRSGLRAPEDAG